MPGHGSSATRRGLALLLMLGTALPAQAEERPRGLIPVPLSRLCVTEGTLESRPHGQFGITVPKLRAVLSATGKQEIEARFVYQGPTAKTAPLGSGAVREQFGLKLRAEDGCNLVYAMWRFAPEPSLVVQVKSNPTLHSSQDCGNGGYSTVTPQRTAPVQAPEIGARQRLSTTLEGAALRVLIDGKPVWEGTLPPEALAVDGPVGIRSDNAQLDLALFAPPETAPGACPKPGGGDVQE
jgi:hypothetical protein